MYEAKYGSQGDIRSGIAESPRHDPFGIRLPDDDDRNRSANFDHLLRSPDPRTATAKALRSPTSTTSRLPRVTPV